MGKKLTQKEWVELARKIHNNKYDYSKVEYVNSKTKVCIVCPEHGEFWQTPIVHTYQKSGCPECAGVKKMTTETFIKKAKNLHGDRYDYSKVEYIHNHKKICIVCPKHGEFWQTPNSHLLGNGCRMCSYEDSVRRPRKKIDKLIEEFNKIHHDKYDYSKITDYRNNKKPLEIICHCKDEKGIEHGSFYQNANNHLNGQGCPKCRKGIPILEQKIIKLLTDSGIEYVYQKRFPEWLGNMSLDFYIPELNIAIECQGEQHYEPVPIFGGENGTLRQKKRDEKKKLLCEEHGIKVVYYTKKWLKEKYKIENSITDLRLLKKILKHGEKENPYHC